MIFIFKINIEQHDELVSTMMLLDEYKKVSSKNSIKIYSHLQQNGKIRAKLFIDGKHKILSFTAEFSEFIFIIINVDSVKHEP
jgi:hypothetical protein